MSSSHSQIARHVAACTWRRAGGMGVEGIEQENGGHRGGFTAERARAHGGGGIQYRERERETQSTDTQAHKDADADAQTQTQT